MNNAIGSDIQGQKENVEMFCQIVSNSRITSIIKWEESEHEKNLNCVINYGVAPCWMRQKWGFIATISLWWICGGSAEPSSSETEISSEDHAIPGSYTVPEGWEKSEKHSTDSQIFT